MEDKILLLLGFLGCLIIAALGVLVWFGIAPFIVKLILSIFAMYSSIALAVLGIYIWRN